MTYGTATLNARRVYFLGVNTGFVSDGEPDNRYVEFYRSRSSDALYCAIVGNVVVPGGHGSNPLTPALSVASVWKDVASAITSKGSLPGIQLATAWEGYTGIRRFVGGSPERVILEARTLVEGLGHTRISKLLDAFDAAAEMALGHGFKHVQIHAAHGYLPSLLIDERINPSAGNVLSRLSDLALRLRGANIETSIRVSLKTGASNFDSQGRDAFHQRIANLPFDVVDLSSGFYNIDKRLIYPARPEIVKSRHDESLALAALNPHRDFILSGRAMSCAPSRLLPNMHLGICRDLIANSDFLRKQEDGCKNHSKCHYFSRGEEHLTCAQWDSPPAFLRPGSISSTDRGFG